ncbi:hypothetical protein Ctob_001531 [Chrysochromulina tobinii]|uniref:Uncharacterized protein n=1 Tax=Chrysochromulina tobinii TaxID=1460289 RepID=A0A0M0J4G1_9EUKA|nr:hypothetical protein Ctob_001531 [Chrysochromulina tobinii]|eukprot:KOO21469.1 hypothetical protein Ctob_001531 [Chrysochromulina sp. CCMP291]
MDGNLDLPSASRLPAPEAAAAAPFAASPADSIPTAAALIRRRSLEGSQVGSPRSIDVVTDEAAQRRATGDLLDVATGSMSLVKEPLKEQPMASTKPAVAAKSPALTPPRAMRSHCSSSSAHTAALVACGPRSDADPNAEAEAEMDTVAMAAAGAEAKSEGPRHAQR